MQVRKANVDDAGWIAAMCHRQFRIAHLGGFIPGDLEYYVDKTFNTGSVRQDLSQATNQYFVAVDGDTPAGCIKIGPVDIPQAKDDPSAIEITRVYLSPAYIGKGVGKLLLKKALAQAKALNKKSAWLHVYKKNQSAIDFYQKHDFKIVGELDFPVRDSCPVGWVMTRPL